MEKIMYECAICQSKYQMGPGRYDGKYIKKYQMNVCDVCFNGNEEGWAPVHEEAFIAHLKTKNIAIPERNEKDYYPRY